MKTLVLEEAREYRGPELRSHFLLETFGLRGSGWVAFQGPCHVQTASLVDLEDRLESESIVAKKMLHFLGEFFGMTLREGVIWQRWWIACFAQCLRDAVPSIKLTQRGNDLYMVENGLERKLSVSIATVTPVSVVMHFGVNIDPNGAPVAAVGLEELGLDAHGVRSVAEAFFAVAMREWESAQWACAKVRPVG